MRLNDELAAEFSALNTTQVQSPSPRFSFSQLPPSPTHKNPMNQIKLSLRAADSPRTIKEEAGKPTFASVFSLCNASNFLGQRRDNS